MTEPAYRYRATCQRVIDGDTIVATIDLGFHVQITEHLRIAGVNTPERGQPGWAEATTYLREILAGKPLIVESYKGRQSFARWVADVWVGGESLADLIVAAGKGLRVNT